MRSYNEVKDKMVEEKLMKCVGLCFLYKSKRYKLNYVKKEIFIYRFYIIFKDNINTSIILTITTTM